jgi:hypothetical protein
MYTFEENTLRYDGKEIKVFPDVVVHKHQEIPAVWRMIIHQNMAAVVNDNGTDALFFQDGEFSFKRERSTYRTFNKAPFTSKGYAEFLLIFFKDKFLIHGTHGVIHLCSLQNEVLKTYQCHKPEFFCSYQLSSNSQFLFLNGWVWQPIQCGALIDLSEVWSGIDTELEVIYVDEYDDREDTEQTPQVQIRGNEVLFDNKPIPIDRLKKLQRSHDISNWLWYEQRVARETVHSLTGDITPHLKVFWWIDQARRVVLEKLFPDQKPRSWSDIHHSSQDEKFEQILRDVFDISLAEWRSNTMAYLGGILELMKDQSYPPEIFIPCSYEEALSLLPDCLDREVCDKIFIVVAIRGPKESLY